MALISTDDIAALLGVTLDSDEETVVDMYITFAVGELEAWLGRPISVQTFIEEVIADADGRVYLSNTPVVSVTSITIDGDDQDLPNFNVTPWGLEGVYYMSRHGVIDDFPTDQFRDYDTYFEPEMIVTYTAGLDIPDGINSVIANGVLRKWNERLTTIEKSNQGSAGIKKLTVEDYSIEYEDGSTFQSSSYGSGANPITIFRSDADFNSIKRYKRRSIA